MTEDQERSQPEEQQFPYYRSESLQPDTSATLEGPGFPGEQPDAEEAPPVRHKPFLSRMLNRIGIPTSGAVDWTFDWLQVFIIAGLLAWLTMSNGIVRMRVPTGSMIPTILEGDSFFVDKFSYLVGLQSPEPGDIVVFWHTESKLCRDGFWIWKWGEAKPCKERYVKRLIAEGPATVVISGGDIHVDGITLTGPAFDRDYFCPGSRDATRECSFPVVEGEYFVLGDNTTNSSDSRYWGGFKKEEFIGEPFFRVWPFERIGPMNSYFGSSP